MPDPIRNFRPKPNDWERAKEIGKALPGEPNRQGVIRWALTLGLDELQRKADDDGQS